MAITKHVRYPDLKAAGVVKNRVGLGRLIKFHNFPVGKLLGPNSRAWTEAEVQAWLDSRPQERPPKAKPEPKPSEADAPEVATTADDDDGGDDDEEDDDEEDDGEPDHSQEALVANGTAANDEATPKKRWRQR